PAPPPARTSTSSAPCGTSSQPTARRSTMAEPTRSRSLTATRTLGAIALLLIGGIHYQQYRYAFYSAVPTIGPLFLANFIGATMLGLFLLAPGKSRLGPLGNVLE